MRSDKEQFEALEAKAEELGLLNDTTKKDELPTDESVFDKMEEIKNRMAELHGYDRAKLVAKIAELQDSLKVTSDNAYKLMIKVSQRDETIEKLEKEVADLKYDIQFQVDLNADLIIKEGKLESQLQAYKAVVDAAIKLREFPNYIEYQDNFRNSLVAALEKEKNK